jgi:hypothetical protein
VVADARVVDQNVDGPELFVYGPDHGPHALRVGNVEVHGDPPAAGGGDLRRHYLGAVAGARRDGDARAHFGEGFCEGLPETRVAAGNDGDLSGQVESVEHAHWYLPSEKGTRPAPPRKRLP